MRQNMSVFDQLVRLGLAVGFTLTLLETGMHMPVNSLWWLLPGVLFVTGATGCCPLYGLVGRFTHRS
jgi:hypothetical protein